MQALLEDYRRGEISKEEYQEAMVEIAENDWGWVEYKTKLEAALKCTVGFRVLIEDNAIKLHELEH